MRMTLVGVGIAGMVSTLAFAFFPLDGSPLGVGDLLDTFVLLGMTFSAVPVVGFASGSKKLSDRSSKAGSGVSDMSGMSDMSGVSGWCKKCPRCRMVVRRRTCFCPNCGANLANVLATRLP